MYLFQKPRRKALSEKNKIFLESAKIQLENGLQETAYYKWGDGHQAILLVHGWESNTARWRQYILEFVNKGYTVIASDAPAHGLSTSTKFNIDQYGRSIAPLIQHYKPSYIIGHSAGGFASILSATLLPTLPPKKYLLLAPNNDIRHIFNTYRDMINMSEKVYHALVKLTDQMNPNGYPISYYCTEKLLKSIDTKTIIIHDKDDSVLPYSESLRLDQIFPNVLLHTTEGLGHRLQSTKVLKIILNEVE